MTNSPQSSSVTNGIRVCVETRFIPEKSNGATFSFVFAYQITIINETDSPVQLLARHWDIIDGYGQLRIVEGPGVVGEQPVIEPYDDYTYSSGCIFRTPLGKMCGYYTMRLENHELVKVYIPEFILSTNFICN